MQSPDLTNTAKMAHAMCRAAHGIASCGCETSGTGGHCDKMAEAGMNAMHAAGLPFEDVRKVLAGPVTVRAKRGKKPKPAE